MNTVEPESEYQRAERAAQYVLANAALRPEIALVLGSGLGTSPTRSPKPRACFTATSQDIRCPAPKATPAGWSLGKRQAYRLPPCRAACICMRGTQSRTSSSR